MLDAALNILTALNILSRGTLSFKCVSHYCRSIGRA
jgi:hypothetical protein